MNKTIKIFCNCVLAPVLFGWLLWSIWGQINNQPQLSQSWNEVKASFSSPKIICLAGAVLLIFCNWGLEACKWRLSVGSIHAVSFAQALKAVLSGVTFSVSMPNRIGEYLGRVLYMPDGCRLKTISATLVGSFAQLITTLVAGLIGLLSLQTPLSLAYPQLAQFYSVSLCALLAIAVVLLLLYFHVGGSFLLFQRWIRLPRYLYLVEALRSFNSRLLLQLLLLSFLRYAVFVLQYLLLFRFFGVAASLPAMAAVMAVVFLAMAVVPSIALVELGLRGQISIAVMGIFSANTLGIGLTSVTIWFINLMLPAIIGLVLMLNLKLLRRKGAATTDAAPVATLMVPAELSVGQGRSQAS